MAMRNRAAARDEGLRRVSSLTRWVAAGAIALAGAMSLVTARILPGRAKSAAQTSVSTPAVDQPSANASNSTAGSGSVDGTNGASSDGSVGADGSVNGDAGLLPPAQAPLPSSGSGRVSSGGS